MIIFFNSDKIDFKIFLVLTLSNNVIFTYVEIPINQINNTVGINSKRFVLYSKILLFKNIII